VLDEVDAVDDVGVPCYLGEVDEEAEELDEEADADGLREVLVYGVSSVVICYAYRYSQKDSDHYACQHGQCCLLVMLAGEQAWILECSQGANYGELGAPENGIGLEMAHFAMCMCVVEGCPELGTTLLLPAWLAMTYCGHICGFAAAGSGRSRVSVSVFGRSGKQH
jgi:hypothetical protein